MIALRHSLLFALLPSGLLAGAQTTAEDYFNQAARQYVKEDRLTALRTLDRGLQAFPQDEKLRKLATELLKNEQQQQQQKQQQKTDQGQQQEQQQEQKQEQQQGQEQEHKQGQEQEKQQQEGRQHEQERQATGSERENVKEDAMSKRDAERVLDALERREQDVQQQVRAKLRPTRRVRIEKDW